MHDETGNAMRRHAELAPACHGAVSADEPLFVLKYRPWRIAWRLFFPNAWVLPLCYMGFFYWSNDTTGLKWWIGKLVFPTFFVGGIWFIADMLLMKSICLYRDKLTKNYRDGRKLAVDLRKAKYDAMSNWFIALTRIYDENASFLSRSFKGVYFDPHLASPKDAEQFNKALSHVSGRNVKELQHAWFSTKLLKSEEGKS